MGPARAALDHAPGAAFTFPGAVPGALPRAILAACSAPSAPDHDPAPPGAVTHHLGAVAQDDAEAERGARIPLRKVRPVRLGWRLADSQGAEGGREQKMPTHGCLPTGFGKRASSLHHVV